MASYIVASGRLLSHGSQPPIREGAAVPADLLAEWGAEGLAANLAIGAVVEVPGEPAAQPRRARG
jgi:hypothetical protein